MSRFQTKNFRHHIIGTSLRSEAMDFIEFLTAKYQQKEIWKKKFKFDWEGGLSHLKEKLTSVDLQHKASGLR
ncbi:MAG: hypothetical protein A7316_03805 [Candidatus Altiarchaeales archaeon WOR_SM1_86-2]|nr:MAG: hypothetical protein A7316_03805 [Candidatus Altiarchaeales archaeon WOR_SM1_86-2]